ncbi:MAG: hypothetical protein QGG53_09460 [Planctomycetota bacterium]|jgi:hypothetical protein|nr:hypothetical protein [Planctomycetota bacterium]
MKTKAHLQIVFLSLALTLPCHAGYGIRPKKLIQGYYKHLYENYKPEFRFSVKREALTAGAVAYIFLAGHRGEFQGNELSSPMIRKSIQRLKAAQLPDGSFGKSEADVDRVSPTVVSILALNATTNPDYSKMLTKAEAWLKNVSDDRLDSTNRFLKLLALNKGVFTSQSAPSVLTLLSDMKTGDSPETQALVLLGSALIRELSETGTGIDKNKIGHLPQWAALTRQAAGKLSEFKSDKNVPGACIVVRILHHCMYAQKRNK